MLLVEEQLNIKEGIAVIIKEAAAVAHLPPEFVTPTTPPARTMPPVRTMPPARATPPGR